MDQMMKQPSLGDAPRKVRLKMNAFELVTLPIPIAFFALCGLVALFLVFVGMSSGANKGTGVVFVLVAIPFGWFAWFGMNLMWLTFHRTRWLCRYGGTVEGVLEKKRATYSGGGSVNTAYVEVRFRAGIGGKVISGCEVQVPGKRWEEYGSGDRVTIFYDPQMPEKYTVLEFSGYEVG